MRAVSTRTATLVQRSADYLEATREDPSPHGAAGAIRDPSGIYNRSLLSTVPVGEGAMPRTRWMIAILALTVLITGCTSPTKNPGGAGAIRDPSGIYSRSLPSTVPVGEGAMPRTRWMIALLALTVLITGCTSPTKNPGGVGSITKHGSTTDSGPSPSPGTVLNLTDWRLQLPLPADQPGQVEEVNWPALNSYSSWYFQVNAAGNGVVFRATAGGATTPGTVFARSELRQMTDDGTRQAAWSSVDSTWSMTVREAITELPPVHPAIVAGQIHGTGSHYVALV